MKNRETPSGPPGSLAPLQSTLVLRVPLLREQLLQAAASFGKRRLRDGTGELDASLSRHLVKHCDRSTVAKQNALRVDGHSIFHITPLAKISGGQNQRNL